MITLDAIRRAVRTLKANACVAGHYVVLVHPSVEQETRNAYARARWEVAYRAARTEGVVGTPRQVLASFDEWRNVSIRAGLESLV